MDSVFDASELEYKNGRVFALRSKICVLQKCKKDNKKGFINHLMFRLLTDPSGKKKANPHRWNNQIPICLVHFSQSEQDDYLRLGFFPENFMGDRFHMHGKSNCYYATSFRFQSFLQKYPALAPSTPLPLAVNVIEELPAAASENLDNLEDQQAVLSLTPPTLPVPIVIEELAAADLLDGLDTAAVEVQMENQPALLVSLKRKAELEETKKPKKRVKSQLKENLTTFLREQNFSAFLKEQGIVNQDQSFFEDLVAKVVEMLSQSLPNEEEFEVQPLVQIEAEPAKNPEPAENPDEFENDIYDSDEFDDSDDSDDSVDSDEENQPKIRRPAGNRKPYTHVYSPPQDCNCGAVQKRPTRSKFERAEPYIQLGSFPTEYDLKQDFDKKLSNFPYRVEGKLVEYVFLEFVEGLTRQQIKDYCAAYANEFVPADDSQVVVFYKKNPSKWVCEHFITVTSIYVRNLEWVEEVKSLTQQAFKDLVPAMHFPGGQRGNDFVNCHCNGILMNTEDIQSGTKGGRKRKSHCKMSREAVHRGFNDRTNYPGLGASIHLGCHKGSGHEGACKFFRTGNFTSEECPNGMSKFVLSEEDHNTLVPMNKYSDTKEGPKPRKNRRNNPLAQKFTNDTANFCSVVVKHFAPLAHLNMSNHVKNAKGCQIGSLEDNCFTCVAANGDLTSHEHLDDEDLSTGCAAIHTLQNPNKSGKGHRQLHFLPCYAQLGVVHKKLNPGAGIAFHLEHGSVLLEASAVEYHGATGVQDPNFYDPLRFASVCFCALVCDLPDHGFGTGARPQEWKEKFCKQQVP